MRTTLTIAALLTCLLGFSQIEGILVHSETKDPIPYVNIWVEGEDIGTTSDKAGRYQLNIDGAQILVFSAVGFVTKRISSDSLTGRLVLKPSIIQINTVVVKPTDNPEHRVVGEIKKSAPKKFFSTRKKPWILARYFEYSEVYKQTPYLQQIRLVTRCEIKNAKFNIRLYRVNEDGTPGEYLFDQNIFGYARKGKRYTEIDISELRIPFPTEGLFVGVESLIIESNARRYTVDRQNYGEEIITKDVELVEHEPSFGQLPPESEDYLWMFLQGKWRSIEKEKSQIKKGFEHLGRAPAIELTLTDQ